MVTDVERVRSGRAPGRVRYVRVPRRTATWRLLHWIQFASILVCAATGFYIADPFFSPGVANVMAWDISIHLYSAMVLDVMVLVIVYLYFFSRSERGIDQLRPTRENLERLKEAAMNVVTLGRRQRFDTSKPDPLNALWFLVLHVLVVLQLMTGLQLYVETLTANMSSVGAWWPELCHFATDWTVPAFGGPVGVRMLHYAVMWFILTWAVLHVYYEWWRTIVWREGDIGIMFGGYKFVTRPTGETADDEPLAGGEEASPRRRGMVPGGGAGGEEGEPGDAA